VIVSAADGIGLAVQTWPGTGGPPLLLVHATGFCKETWDPLVTELRAAGTTVPVVAFDQRGHGASEKAPHPIDWWDLGRDVLAVRDALADPPRAAVGHSSGAAALVCADLLRPGGFDHLVLIEPIIFPPPYRRFEDNPMSVMALKRRERFASRHAARTNFRAKGPFARWEDRALDAYLAGGFVEDDDGIRLRCTPAEEAEFYRGATAHGAWSRLGEIGAGITLVAGADSDSHPAAFLADMAAAMEVDEAVVIPGATHFVPMERPDALAGLVAPLLE
jgi:pimeloyl-ACP methyl ester carboxylesterase